MPVRAVFRALALLAVVLALPQLAHAAFPGNPGESPRANTPNDPGFDPCEADDETTPGVLECQSYFNEQFGAFGFSPDTAQVAPGVRTQYADCSQLDLQGRLANIAAGDPECAQIAGIRADIAWKYSIGSPRVAVAILDTGIEWDDADLVNKVRLNGRELPRPRQAGGDCARDDCNRDGAFDVRDFERDPRIDIAAGDEEADEILDASDLIATFSDGVDDDRNDYTDDIAGWDFFDDDNDPFDVSSCCSAEGHGSGRAGEAVAETNDGRGQTGMCPRCQLMPLRVWDTFVVPTDNYAMAAVYAADNGAAVIEGAVGGLTNTRFARRSIAYADHKGVALTLVSSDINSANHNYPTNYNEAIYVGGSLPDTAPSETCSGPGGLPFLPSPPDPPEQFVEGCNALVGALSGAGLPASLQPPTTSFFRNSNLTQYGGKADIVLVGQTGSVNTGQAAGVAGLIQSFAIQTLRGQSRFPRRLSSNEVRQLLTMTAEDVLAANTGVIGLPDRANRGWDTHFGYGRVNLAGAMARIANDPPGGAEGRREWPCAVREPTCIPPEAQIDAPDWFTPINLERVGPGGVAIRGHVAAPHTRGGVGRWEIEYACGQDAPDSSFRPLPGARGRGAADGELGRIPRSLIAQLAVHCDGSVRNDAGRPAGTAAQAWPANPFPSPDPERHAFQIRLTAHAAGNPENIGRYRKTLFAYTDDGNHAGWPRPIGSGSSRGRLATGSGGEAAPRLYDLNGDNRLDVVLPTSSGELWVLRTNGRPLASWNGGRPVRTRLAALARAHPPPAATGAPRESLRVPAIGDIDADLEPEIVATAGEHVYAWEADGSPVRGFPVRIDPRRSAPCKPGAPTPCFDADDRLIDKDNHIKRGFIGSAALANLDCRGGLDVVAGALDQHLYAWNGAGRPLRGFPRKLDSDGAVGAEIITTPTIAELDGNGCGEADGPGGGPEVVIATNEAIAGEADFPASVYDIFNVLIGAATAFNPIYAVHGDGTEVDGWPVRVGVAAGDLLPLVLPSYDAAALDTDGDGDDELIASAATSVAGLGGTRLVDGAGQTIRSFLPGVANSPDQGPVINLADYPTIGDVAGTGSPWLLKGGLTASGAVNLLASNQNLPYSHVEQAWEISSGASAPGYPRPTDDYQLLSGAPIARVGGRGPGRQALVGTGLYQLHAYGAGGREPPRWPKFTGGWTQPSPAVGDADADGRLDVIALTREGWSFLWRTDVPACADSNEEWWSYHHDEHASGNYGADTRPPGTPERLVARRAGERLTLRWRAPGDDWTCGSAERVLVVGSDAPITSAAAEGTLLDNRSSDAAGAAVTRTLGGPRIDGVDFVAVLYRDEAGNWGHMARARVGR